MQKKPTSAYVHIPFCTQICYYCDFSKVFIKNQPVDSYLKHLLEEFRSYDIQKLRTLYIGGGTPTALSAPQLEVLLDGLTKNLDLSALEELTIEANPGDLDADKIAVLKQSPVNRVSLGVQTFDNKMLKKIGRSHLEKDIYENIDRLKLAGFDNISIDLIYALPGQTMAQVKDNVAKAISLDIPHMSLYSLVLSIMRFRISPSLALKVATISCTGIMPSIMVSVRVLQVMWTEFVIKTTVLSATISMQ